MIPLLAFAATIELQCVDVDKFMENVESVKIVHMTKNQKKEVREALSHLLQKDVLKPKEIIKFIDIKPNLC
jgi:sensor domain CHASE-containing protein